MSLKTLIIFVVLVQSLSGQWIERKNGLPETWRVGGGCVIEPIDSLTAYVALENGKFYKTMDAGLNWIDITSPTFPTNLSVEEISAVNEDSIWFCGYSLDSTYVSKIYASYDGGQSWIKQHQRTAGNIWFIEMFSVDSGMAAGYSYSDVPAPMLQTYDGGVHWIEKNKEHLIEDYGVNNGIDIVDMDVVFHQKKWWTLSKSTDGGTSWDSIYTTSGGEVVNFYDRQFGLLGTVWGQIIRSVDGGETWELISDLPLNSSNCLEFLPGDPSKIWWSLNYHLFFSEDSGRSWTEYPFEEVFWSYDIDFVDDRHGWIMAENMVYYTKTGDRILSSLNTKSYLPVKYKLSQNYPNPFNPTTTIDFSLPFAEIVHFEIFDITGKKVETLISKKMRAGMHSVKFNSQNYSSGVYLYQIKAGSFRAVKKMIVIK